MSVEIRRIRPDDVADVLRLIHDFAAYEHLHEYCEVTVDQLNETLFGCSAFVEGLVAVDSAQIIGYTLFYRNFASFRGQIGLYLEDIYVSASHRGKGIGEDLLRAVARLGTERGAARIDFQVLDWNSAAISFYRKLGAVQDEAERHFKFTDKAFSDLASHQAPAPD